MNLILKRSLVLSGILSLGLSANADVICDASKSACYIDTMPLYSQNDSAIGSDLLPLGASRSMLCAPTSGAMVLESIVKSVKAPTVVKASSWTQLSFINISANLSFRDQQNAQIRAMSKKMSTNGRSGTALSNMAQGAALRKSDFTPVGDGVSTAYPSAFPASSYQGYIRDDKSSVTLSYGHYNRTSRVSNGKTYYSYARNGGHAVALNSFSGDKFLIYNPWYAVKEERKIVTLNKGCNGDVCENLPGLKQRSLIGVSGSYYQFIDNHSRLWLN